MKGGGDRCRIYAWKHLMYEYEEGRGYVCQENDTSTGVGCDSFGPQQQHTFHTGPMELPGCRVVAQTSVWV
jgi:hypothetical protein